MSEVVRRDLVVYFAVNRKVHLPLLSHREHIKAGLYCTIFEFSLSYLRARLWVTFEPAFELPLNYLWLPLSYLWARLQNSRIFCERERRTIFERKAGASEKWWEALKPHALRACEARAIHTRGSRLRRFPPSENDCFAVYLWARLWVIFELP